MDYRSPKIGQTAEEYLSVLSPRNTALWGEPGKWVFRGQSDDDWHLIPSALRVKGQDHLVGLRGFGFNDAPKPRNQDFGNHEYHQQIRLMKAILSRFHTRFTRSGLHLEKDCINTYLEAERGEPTPDVLPFLALAQHHGVPTLLLDWSRRSYVAAYFSAMVGQGARDDQRIAVWCLNQSVLPKGVGYIQFHEPSAWQNPNLAAQDGLFTWTDQEGEFINANIEDMVSGPIAGRCAIERDCAIGEDDVLRKIVLSTQQAGRLLQLLSYEGFDGSTLYPGVDGMVRALKEREHW